MVVTIPFNHTTKEDNIFFFGSLDSINGVRKKNIILIHLETQYAKTDCKNEIYAKNWVRRTWIEKVNPKEKSTVKVNASKRSGQR